MSTYIGTNFKYQAEEFLDERQGLAQTKKDLLEWGIPIPESFRVCCEGEWYIYDSEAWSDETGHWMIEKAKSPEEVISSKQTVAAGQVFESLGNLEQSIHETKDMLSGCSIVDVVVKPGTAFEIGTEVMPEMTWKLVKPDFIVSLVNGKPEWSVIPGTDVAITPDRVEVIGAMGVIGDNKQSWRSTDTINFGEVGTKTLTIHATYLDKIINYVTSIYFRKSVYWGSFSGTVFNNTQIDGGGVGWSSALTTGGTLSQKTFNCSGGKYPYILIPKEYYNVNYKTYVNYNLNSDFIKREVNVRNRNGIVNPYIMYRTTGIQTGSAIGIEIK